MLKEIENIRFDSSLSIEVFKNIPTIKDWIENMMVKLISKKMIRNGVNVMYNVCTHLKTHIENPMLYRKLYVQRDPISSDIKLCSRCGIYDPSTSRL